VEPNAVEQKILLVDDDEGYLLATRLLLEAVGYQVTTATSAADARDKLATDRPHLILLDVVMPGEDGFAFAKSLSEDEAQADIPVMFVTSLADRPDQMRRLLEEHEELGPGDILPKSTAHALLVPTIREEREELAPVPAPEPVAVPPTVPIPPAEDIRDELQACFQCRKCTAGCPAMPWSDHPPHRMVQWAREGNWGRALSALMPWVCASCLTCSARCPNGVPVAELMDALKQMALRLRVAARDPHVLAAHETFLAEVLRRGRIHELSLVSRYKLRTGRLFQDARLGLALLLRGKLRLIPDGAELPDKLKEDHE